MKMLEITAHVSYYVAMEGQADLPLHCCYEAVNFIDGTQPIEKELRSLETFRRAVLSLIEEGVLRCQENREDVEPPTVTVKLKGGEECSEPDSELVMTLSEIQETGAWSLNTRWGERTSNEIIAVRPDALLAILKQYMHEETSEWFARVQFQGSSVE